MGGSPWGSREVWVAAGPPILYLADLKVDFVVKLILLRVAVTVADAKQVTARLV